MFEKLKKLIEEAKIKFPSRISLSDGQLAAIRAGSGFDDVFHERKQEIIPIVLLRSQIPIVLVLLQSFKRRPHRLLIDRFDERNDRIPFYSLDGANRRHAAPGATANRPQQH